MTAWTDMNPWTDEYLQRELATMSQLDPFDNGRLVLKHQHVMGVVQCYMRDDFLDWGPFPWLGERPDDKTEGPAQVWMSLTPQEIESQYMPIALATGRVGIGGLGLGYAARRILSKPDVDEVVVYETNPDVIALYERNFPKAEPRLRIVRQDVGTVRGESFELFYNDVYAAMLESLTFEHWNTLPENNEIGLYHPWGLEAMLMSFVQNNAKHHVPFHLRNTYFPYLRQLLEAVTTGERGAISEFYVPTMERAQHDAATLGYDLWPLD